jgi:hypothetical protein
MTHQPLSPQKLLEIRAFAAQWGKIIARRALDDSGPAAMIDFRTMEQVAAAAAAGLTEGTLDTLLQQQVNTLPSQQPCPQCGHPCPVGSEDRTMKGPNAQVLYHEPVCHCPACRRDFFPPADPAEAGQPRL